MWLPRYRNPQHCTYTTVQARFWPELSGKSSSKLFWCSLFARKRRDGNTRNFATLYGKIELVSAQVSFRSFRFFELPTKADSGTGSAEKPCFLSDHIHILARFGLVNLTRPEVNFHRIWWKFVHFFSANDQSTRRCRLSMSLPCTTRSSVCLPGYPQWGQIFFSVA